MLSPTHAQMMARYNRWQNASLYSAADALDEHQRKEDRNAFFGSVHGTLAHILWADRVWMHRFAGTSETSPEDNQGQGAAYQDWDALKAEREAFDETILEWTRDLDEDWLGEDFTWWNTTRTRKSTLPAWELVAHFFNHQTHHRGQAHALLTAFGLEPDATDFVTMALRESASGRGS